MLEILGIIYLLRISYPDLIYLEKLTKGKGRDFSWQNIIRLTLHRQTSCFQYVEIMDKIYQTFKYTGRKENSQASEIKNSEITN